MRKVFGALSMMFALSVCAEAYAVIPTASADLHNRTFVSSSECLEEAFCVQGDKSVLYTLDREIGLSSYELIKEGVARSILLPPMEKFAWEEIADQAGVEVRVSTSI